MSSLQEERDRRKRIFAELLAGRRESGLSQIEVASRMGVSPSAVSVLESGRHTPRWRTLNRYAEAIRIKPRSGLSWRQRAILRMVLDHMQVHGYAPSAQEIGAAVGLSSIDSVVYQLSALQASECLEREPGKPRAMKVTPLGQALVAVKPPALVPLVRL